MPVATRSDERLTPFETVTGGSTTSPDLQHAPGASSERSSAEAAPAGQSASSGPEEDEVLRQIRNLPPELAVLLLSVGTLGFLLPGIIGTPALIAGGLALWPKAFGRAETWFARRYPLVHRKSLHQMGRFLADLDRRYPHLPPG